MLDLMTRAYVRAYVAFKTREEGQTLVEYALIIALVAIVLIGALNALAASISGVFADISDALDSAVPG